jgi:exodeoxyribonuclease III
MKLLRSYLVDESIPEGLTSQEFVFIVRMPFVCFIFFFYKKKAFKVASWNVAGLRALVKKTPSALSDLVKKYNVDMLCLQEHKLQEIHLVDPKLNLKGLLEDEGYDEYYSFSTAKKGYSGTAVFIRRNKANKATKQKQLTSFFAPKRDQEDKGGPNKDEKQLSNVNVSCINPELLVPIDVSYDIGKPIDNEGRTVIVDMPWATLVNVYVPNSGQKLERLDYRTKEWDKFFLEFMQSRRKNRNLPVIWLGDLNIAHRALDIWNDGASHLDKQAGVTPQERESFTSQLEAGFVDVFRRLHPDAKGHYSYWSQRAGNREPNKGLRLDYFVCSPDLFNEDSKVVVRDSYMVMEQLGSDHGPVVLELEIKP